MSNLAVRVENLSKQYQIGARREQYDTFRESLVRGLRSAFQRKSTESAYIWALKELSFEVRQGEALGIVGGNGAGKSTLLKVLSRITEPTTGQAEIHGRVASLLEVGTGFHGELTGRENIYLNAAILGMRKNEVDSKFDEIVDFAGVEKFIDTPVKHYSSGMYMRLAFAVAAHLDPEILVVDEVLAVGDAGFQRKCIGKMSQVAQGGRTVLFVSHNIGAISNLCTKGLWLDSGKLAKYGDIASVTSAYVKSNQSTDQENPENWRRAGTGEARFIRACLLNSNGQIATSFQMGETIVVEFDIDFHVSVPSVVLSVEVKRCDSGMYVLHMQNDDFGLLLEGIRPGRRRYRVEIPDCMLYPTSYQIALGIWVPGMALDHVHDILEFEMIQSDVTKRTTRLTLHNQAVFYVPTRWYEVGRS